jgi:hypothetical protein
LDPHTGAELPVSGSWRLRASNWPAPQSAEAAHWPAAPIHYGFGASPTPYTSKHKIGQCATCGCRKHGGPE